jgi:hypothetical protein
MPSRKIPAKVFTLIINLLLTCSSILLFTVRSSAYFQDEPKLALHSRRQTKEKLHFKIMKVGKFRDQDGTHLAFTSYQASDGVKLTVTHCRFDSQVEAHNFFGKQVGRATKVMNRTERRDVSGGVYIERAEVIFPDSSGTNEQLSAIIWTNGPEFHEILSNSLKDNLELERQLTGGPKIDR